MTLPKLRHQPDPSNNIQICAKSMARMPNLWHGSHPNLWHGGQVCGMAAKSVAWWPNLWHGGQICSTATKSVVRQPNLWHCYQICGTGPNLWHGGQIWKQNRKFVYKRTKIRVYIAFLILKKQNKKLNLTTIKCALHQSFPVTYIYYFILELPLKRVNHNIFFYI